MPVSGGTTRNPSKAVCPQRRPVEGRLPPTQKRVTLAVPFVLALGIDEKRCFSAVGVDLDRVVDHEIGWDLWADRRWITAHLCHRVTHRPEIDQRGDTGEVLEQHAGRCEHDLARWGGSRVPARQRFDIAVIDRVPVLVTEQILEQDLERVWQA
jgi:hypothetical protein